MRDAHEKLAKHSWRRRRAALALILLTSSPTLADDFEGNPVEVLPPLPLQPMADAQRTQSNPFCEPFVNLELLKVQLASGNHSSSIKLKPIGAAIGLHSINDADLNRAPTPIMTIEPVPTASIQTNPMAGSMHHANDQLVDAEVDDRAIIVRPKNAVSTQDASTKRSGRKSSIVLLRAAPAKSQVVQPMPSSPLAIGSPPVVGIPASRNTAKPSIVLRSSVIPSPVPHNSAVPNTTILHSSTGDPAVQGRSNTSAQSIVPPQPLTQEPPPAPAVKETNQEKDRSVYFSLTDKIDRSEKSVGGDGKKATPQAESANAAEFKNLVATERLAEVAKTAEPVKPNSDAKPSSDVEPSSDAEGVAVGPRIRIGVVEPIVISDSGSGTEFESIDSVITDSSDAPIAIYRSKKSVLRVVTPAEESLHAKRYRSPVAVKSVPIAVGRDELEAPSTVVKSTVQRVDEFNPDGFTPSPALDKLTPLYMTRAQVRSLTIGGEVRRVKVANESVCQAFAAGPNQLKLIGTGNGVTRLVVWADSDDAGAPTRMRSFEVHVKDPVETTGDATAKKAMLLNQSIRKAFPKANVLVRSNRYQLIVAGTCESEATAKMIIRMVRKTCLVPVKDELLVR